MLLPEFDYHTQRPAVDFTKDYVTSKQKQVFLAVTDGSLK
jgi:hypothetical protein